MRRRKFSSEFKLEAVKWRRIAPNRLSRNPAMVLLPRALTLNGRRLPIFSLGRCGAPSMAVHLRPLRFTEQRVVDAIKLDAEQQRFAGGSIDDIFRALNDSKYPDALHPFCLVADQQAVGFLVLREGAARPAWALKNTISLHSFRVSKPFQGRGFGADALRLAGRWISVKRPAVTQMMLTVNADNPAASALYLRCGFQPTGTIFQGRIGRERVLIGAVAEIARTAGER